MSWHMDPEVPKQFHKEIARRRAALRAAVPQHLIDREEAKLQDLHLGLLDQFGRHGLEGLTFTLRDACNWCKPGLLQTSEIVRLRGRMFKVLTRMVDKGTVKKDSRGMRTEYTCENILDRLAASLDF